MNPLSRNPGSAPAVFIALNNPETPKLKYLGQGKKVYLYFIQYEYCNPTTHKLQMLRNIYGNEYNFMKSNPDYRLFL